jgi:glycosyltransferase involved in cell wall biosynthesis
MNLPLVSVIIPAFNREDTIARSIDSVLVQNYRPIEVIVVDDGSTDRTVEVVQSYGEEVILIRQSNGGPSSARNSGAARARGEIISFLDSDDTWHPEKLTRQVDLMIRGGNQVPCCICNANLIAADGSIKTSFQVAQVNSKLYQGYWINPTEIISTRFVLFNQVFSVRRDAFELVGGFNESMRLLEDHDLAFRLSLLGPWGFIQEALVEKYNDSEGIGVIAMKDPSVHLKALACVLNGFLDQPIPDGGKIEQHIRSSLNDVITEVSAIRMTTNGGKISKLSGEVINILLRIKRGILRRLPSWPQVQAVCNLSTTVSDSRSKIANNNS